MKVVEEPREMVVGTRTDNLPGETRIGPAPQKTSNTSGHMRSPPLILRKEMRSINHG